MNSGVLGYQRHAEDALLGRHTSVCDFRPVDHAAIARACGVSGIRVERPEDIAEAIKEAIASEACVLIDVITDPNAMPPVGLHPAADLSIDSQAILKQLNHLVTSRHIALDVGCALTNHGLRWHIDISHHHARTLLQKPHTTLMR